MKKKLFLCTICVVAYTFLAQAQTPRIDSLALYVLKRAAATIQHLSSCKYTAHITYDVLTDDLGLIKHSYTDEVAMSFPDKMHIMSTGDKGKRLMIYNKEKFYLYSYDKNTFVEANAPETIIGAIHAINYNYGIEFPAADFFYPTFVEDVLATGGNLIYLGTTWIDGQECHHIAGLDTNKTGFQFWITDIHFIPVKMVMVYGSEKEAPQYEATYTNWVLNPALPSSLFEFIPPPSAIKTKLTPIIQSTK